MGGTLQCTGGWLTRKMVMACLRCTAQAWRRGGVFVLCDACWSLRASFQHFTQTCAMQTIRYINRQPPRLTHNNSGRQKHKEPRVPLSSARKATTTSATTRAFPPPSCRAFAPSTPNPATPPPSRQGGVASVPWSCRRSRRAEEMGRDRKHQTRVVRPRRLASQRALMGEGGRGRAAMVAVLLFLAVAMIDRVVSWIWPQGMAALVVVYF